PVDLPIDGAALDSFIKEMTAKYGGKKAVKATRASEAAANMASTFPTGKKLACPPGFCPGQTRFLPRRMEKPPAPPRRIPAPAGSGTSDPVTRITPLAGTLPSSASHTPGEKL